MGKPLLVPIHEFQGAVESTGVEPEEFIKGFYLNGTKLTSQEKQLFWKYYNEGVIQGVRSDLGRILLYVVFDLKHNARSKFTSGISSGRNGKLFIGVDKGSCPEELFTTESAGIALLVNGGYLQAWGTEGGDKPVGYVAVANNIKVSEDGKISFKNTDVLRVVVRDNFDIIQRARKLHDDVDKLGLTMGELMHFTNDENYQVLLGVRKMMGW